MTALEIAAWNGSGVGTGRAGAATGAGAETGAAVDAGIETGGGGVLGRKNQKLAATSITAPMAIFAVDGPGVSVVRTIGTV